MHALGTCYVKYFNHIHERTGTLWEGRFRACLVDSEEYFLVVSRYIKLNPVRAGMVKHPDEYSWSSYRRNAMGYDIKLLTPHPLYLALGQDDQGRQKAYQTLFGSHITDSAVDEIRSAINKSNVLGNAHFKRNLEERFGQCIGHLQIGGDRKSANFKSGGQSR